VKEGKPRPRRVGKMGLSHVTLFWSFSYANSNVKGGCCKDGDEVEVLGVEVTK
jgi:hypothetical protein